MLKMSSGGLSSSGLLSVRRNFILDSRIAISHFGPIKGLFVSVVLKKILRLLKTIDFRGFCRVPSK